MENSKFLKEKYNLHASPEVESAAKHNESDPGEKLPQDPSSRIRNYLDRLERLALDPDKEQSRKMLDGQSRPRALSLLREMIMNKYVRPNKDKLAQGAARVEERAARELGIQAEYGEQELEQRGQIAVEDLERSLDNWIAYLSDANEPYPVWFRYYAFRNILDLGDYDKDKGEFTKRSQASTRLFPEVDRGALAYVEQVMEASEDPEMLAKLQKGQQALQTPADQLLTKEKAVQFSKLSFAKQYAEGIKQAGEITPEMRTETQGSWVKYQQGTDPTALWASLQNKGTAWCTKGFGTAQAQLQGGDFYVYYTLDRQGKPAIPRIAIRMQGDSIGEVRGVADSQQNLEGNMADIAQEKMRDLPGAENYLKKSADMRQLTAIEKKTKTGQDLTKDDLVFLYEIDGQIQGFGYDRDPRITELRESRNPEQDMLTVLECTKDQIAHKSSEISEDTKVYLGSLEPGIFTILQQKNMEHVYTSFPEGKIRRQGFEIGGKSAEQVRDTIKEKEDAQEIKVSRYAWDMLKSKDFTTLPNAEKIETVRLKVRDLGLPNGATTDQIYAKAQELGLELCPAEVGPAVRLQYMDQPMGEYFWIAMKQIADRDRYPNVFHVIRSVDGLWLFGRWAYPGVGWDAGIEFMFSMRKLES